ncbi:MAG: 3-phosphoshikimate 1-carboxyvinyltransferase [Acidimicrobiia bacterium]|nr:3-phosphoshikimate 1-carboxyvinyltransferase [Acidimicrobiia bacterium]
MVVEPLTRPPDVTVPLPGSKSITNRALLAAAMADGTSTLMGGLVADDTDAMVGAARALGATVELGETAWTVTGTAGVARRELASVDARQAGTVARFVPAVAAATGATVRVDGSTQLRSRPMGPLLDALRDLGAVVEEEGTPGHLPITVKGPLPGSTAQLPGDASSQFLSGLLLAGPLHVAGLEVHLTTHLVSRPYAAMTAAVMAAFGAAAEIGDDVCRAASGGYRSATYVVEPDASAASYFWAAAAITGGRVRIEGLGRASIQGDVAFADVLAGMGASVTVGDDATEVTGARLHGIDVDLGQLSDTAPTLAVVAAVADSPTRVRGIGFVRTKESDRIAAVVEELRRCGVDAEEEPDGFVVRPNSVRPAVIDPHDDHRMAMAFAVLGLRVPGIEIADPRCVSKTFPAYFDVLDTLRR